ncbi:TlpA family protein disulfide reductase [Cryptosporangium phraense]|uniref:Thioredoxin family protein n=1 Tax=Cryptosporangium phraense TaxID=2593070 RepID=A0A545AHD2_9ACTN|nr:thioredoxin family protein [Cryptosporangium phraense]TQS40734.1 thioredoxin family protein [Cryptosporangium phraense]
MDLGVRVLVLLAVLVVATAGGLVWRARNGRVRSTADEGTHMWEELGIRPEAAAVTLVQFSSAFCAPCRATRRILTDVAGRLPQVQHVEVDAESHLDAVRALDVQSTPTTLLVDRTGRIAGRAVGQPRRDDVLKAIGPFLSDQ